MGHPGPPGPACGAPRARTPCVRYPVPRRPETGLDGSAGTSSMDAILAPGPPPSIQTWNVTPGNEHPVRKGRAADADPEPGLGTAAAGSRRLLRLGGALSAVRPPRLAGRLPGCYVAR